MYQCVPFFHHNKEVLMISGWKHITVAHILAVTHHFTDPKITFLMTDSGITVEEIMLAREKVLTFL